MTDPRAAARRDGTDPNTDHPMLSDAQLVVAFAAPPPSVSALLGNPGIAPVLRAASEALAPGGIAEDAGNRYAASVIETHLVARERLDRQTNALLKT